MLFARPIRNLQRWRYMQAVLLRYGFDFLIEREELKEVREILSKRFHLPGSDLLKKSMPVRVRLMLEELGPTYIKLGQILSTRSDLLPKEWIEELSKLQDSVPSFHFQQVKETIEADLGKPLEEIYLEFNPVPIAAASIGQVHYARLMNLEEVVVKVRRPGVVPQVHSDMEIIHEVVRLVEARTTWGKRYGVVSILNEFARTLNLEMDYRNEATNAIRLRKAMGSMARVRVPYIYWNLTSERILTMEYIDGVKINDLEKLDAAGVNRSELAEIFIRSIFKQLLIDGFFHADPHPANLFVDLKDQTLVYLDLGMMGRLLPEQRQILSDIFRSIIRRDSEDVCCLVMTIGTPFQKVDENSLKRSIDHIINRYLEVSLEDISFAALIAEILKVIFTHGVRLPSELSLAFKTIMQGEEVARTLDRKIVILDIAKTASQQVMLQMLNPSNLLDQINDAIREFYRLRKVIPRALESILKQFESGNFKVSIDIPEFHYITHSIIIIANRLTVGLIIIGMLIGSALAMGIPPNQTWAIVPILGVIGFIAALLFGGILVYAVVKDILTANRKEKKRW
jgi:ubiquinone biosynthesis protein